MDGLFWNKVFGALGFTLIFVIGITEVSHMLVHPHELEEAAYPIEIPEPTTGAPVEEGPDDIGALLAAADPARGQTLARTLCASCHTFGEGEPTLTGPNLHGVVGRTVASVEGFNYTPAMRAHGGDWTYDALWTYLENPPRAVPGTAMTFAGFPKETDRANVIAYLSSLSASPVPFPAPMASAAAVSAPATEESTETPQTPEQEAPAQEEPAEPAQPGPIHNPLQ